MKSIGKFVALLIALFTFMLTSCTNVDVGQVGIKIYKLGGAKGVDSEVLNPGRYWIGVNEDLFLFPTFQQNKVWTADEREDSPTDESFTFQTSDAMTINCDIGISYSFDKAKIIKIFEKYRKGPDEITNVILRREVRNAFNVAASKIPIEDVINKGKIRLLEEVKDSLKARFEKEGIVISDIGYIGALRLPAQILAAIDAKNTAKQVAEQRENELRQTQAEAAKVMAEARGDSAARVIRAQGEAKANEQLTQKLTSMFIEYRKNELHYRTWKGEYPQWMPGSDVKAMVQMPTK